MPTKPLPIPKAPNPGSPEAIQQGCKCSAADNGNGRGSLWGIGVFVRTAGCPLHPWNPITGLVAKSWPRK